MITLTQTELGSISGGASRQPSLQQPMQTLPGQGKNYTVEYPNGRYANGDAKSWATYKIGPNGQRGDLISSGDNPPPAQ